KTHADQFNAGRLTSADKQELEHEAYASEASALERLHAHDEVHDRSDVRPAAPPRDHDSRNDPQRSGPGRHDPPHRGDDPPRTDPGRGTHLFRGVDDTPDSLDDRPHSDGNTPTGNGADHAGLSGSGTTSWGRNELVV